MCASGTRVCLKVYKAESAAAVHRELVVLFRLSDPDQDHRVANLVGYNLSHAPFFLVMEMAGGTSSPNQHAPE